MAWDSLTAKMAMTSLQLAMDLDQALRRFKGNPRLFHERILAQNGGAWFDWEAFVRACYEAILQPGSVSVDCGANHGVHTIHMARAVAPCGRVLSIEPVSSLSKRVQELERSYGVPTGVITYLACAVSDSEGEAEFYHLIDDNLDGLSGLRRRSCLDGRPISTFRVQVRTMDEICADLKRLDFMKLDIEGAELDALRGARKTLARHRPIFTLEQGEINQTYYNYTWSDLLTFLDDVGYRLFDLFGLAYSDPTALSGCLVWDFVAFPKERSPAMVIWRIRQAMRAGGVVL